MRPCAAMGDLSVHVGASSTLFRSDPPLLARSVHPIALVVDGRGGLGRVKGPRVPAPAAPSLTRRAPFNCQPPREDRRGVARGRRGREEGCYG